LNAYVIPFRSILLGCDTVVGQAAPDVAKRGDAFIVRVKQSKKIQRVPHPRKLKSSSIS
jgi:hypothetical protein